MPALPLVCFFLHRGMISAQERKIKKTGCDVRFDNLTPQLYSTDASIYQIRAVDVAFLKTAEQIGVGVRVASMPEKDETRLSLL